jgi:hypothetical protein
MIALTLVISPPTNFIFPQLLADFKNKMAEPTIECRLNPSLLRKKRLVEKYRRRFYGQG